MDLFSKALEIQPSAKVWCDELGLSRNTLATAKIRGRLSPGIAGGIAMKLGENPIEWIAIAALEAEPESSYKKELLQRVTSLYFALGGVVAFFQRPLCSALWIESRNPASDISNISARVFC
jgi:hypothetical protein